MTPEEFTTLLRQEGFEQTVLVERAPNGGLDLHEHPFESKALVVSGEITLGVEGVETVYRAGEVFHLSHAQPHVEHYGAEGVSYLVGRR